MDTLRVVFGQDCCVLQGLLKDLILETLIIPIRRPQLFVSTTLYYGAGKDAFFAAAHRISNDNSAQFSRQT